jgi:peptidoglycan hydrolase CwlO-like protein
MDDISILEAGGITLLVVFVLREAFRGAKMLAARRNGQPATPTNSSHACTMKPLLQQHDVTLGQIHEALTHIRDDLAQIRERVEATCARLDDFQSRVSRLEARDENRRHERHTR